MNEIKKIVIRVDGDGNLVSESASPSVPHTPEQRKPITEESSLVDIIAFVEGMGAKRIETFTLPTHIDYTVFLVELGRTKRSFEFGGDFNPATRMIRVTRSQPAEQFGFNSGETLSSVGYPDRRDENGQIVGTLWHTHPWETQEMTYSRRYGKDHTHALYPCPSDVDNNNIFAYSLCEAEEGTGRIFISEIAAAGYLSETVATGLELNIAELIELGCAEEAIHNLLAFIGIMPPLYLENYALPEYKDEFKKAVDEYYQRKLQNDGSFSRGIDEFIEMVQPLLRKDLFERMTTTAAQKVRKEMLRTLPTYPNREKLKEFGFDSRDKQDAVLQMLGMKTSIFQVDSEGNRTPVEIDVYSCDTEDILTKKRI